MKAALCLLCAKGRMYRGVLDLSHFFVWHEILFEHLLLKYSLDKNETLYVGNDLNADIRGAKRAGMKAAYIHSNLSPADDTLAQAKRLADFVTDKFEALSEYLVRLPR